MHKLLKSYLILFIPLIVFFIFPRISFAYDLCSAVNPEVPCDYDFDTSEYTENIITLTDYFFTGDCAAFPGGVYQFFNPSVGNFPYGRLYFDNTLYGYVESGVNLKNVNGNTVLEFGPVGEGYNNYLAVKDYCFNPTDYKATQDIYEFGGQGAFLYPANVSSTPPIPETNTFEFPAYAGYVPTGETILSGQCKNPGQNYGLFTRELFDVNDYYDPDITCENDYTWSDVKNTNSGGNSWYLYDFVSEEWVEHYYYGTDSNSLIWSLGFQYPQLDAQNTAKVAISNSFPFRARYTIESANFDDVEIHLDKCSDSTFSSCQTEILDNTLPYFDEDKTGYFEFSMPTVNGYEYYDFYMVNSSIVTYSLKFRVLGSTDTNSQVAILPDKKDLGYWGNIIRDFVMPPYGYFEVKINNLKNVFFEKFVFINQIRNSINARASTPSDSLFTSPTINFLGEDYVVIGPGTLDAFLPTMRNILTGLIYFLLSFFVIRSVSKIINT